MEVVFPCLYCFVFLLAVLKLLYMLSVTLNSLDKTTINSDSPICVSLITCIWTT